MPGSLAAHEFWIDPASHSVSPGDEIEASLRIGQHYDGDSYPYLSSRFATFTVTNATGTRDYEGHQGDEPAFGMTAEAPGLTVISYVSTPSRLIYRKWEKFVGFTENEGLTGAVAQHKADGLPETGFREDYRRHAKALVQVGPVDAEAREVPQGLEFELVTLANPFNAAIDTLPVRLLRYGKPAPDVQITIFRKDGPDGDATTETLRTDERGEARIALKDGARHLLNAVVMDRSDKPGIDWESEWASLTFARP